MAQPGAKGPLATKQIISITESRLRMGPCAHEIRPPWHASAVGPSPENKQFEGGGGRRGPYASELQPRLVWWHR